MLDRGLVHINLDKVLHSLFCVYAFSLPFELVLEILLGIDTIFKPFRIINLVIIVFFAIKAMRKKVHVPETFRTDLFLYGILIYGLLISLIRIIIGVFDFGLFFNDLFQFGLYISCFFIYKSQNFNLGESRKIFKFFLAGFLVNAVYISYNFYFLGRNERLAGFMDNPNYAALGLLAAIIFYFLRIGFKSSIRKRILTLIILVFLLQVFAITGSRTGMVMFVISSILILSFFNWKTKLLSLLGAGALILILFFSDLQISPSKDPFIMLRRVSNTLSSNQEDVRFTVWRGIFNALEETGYAGMGIGQFKANFSGYFTDTSNKIILEMVNRGYFLSTHNDMLAILTDYGLPGLLFFISFLFFSFRGSLMNLKYQHEDPEVIFHNKLKFILLCSVFIFGLAAENFQHQLFWFLLMFSTDNLIPNEEFNSQRYSHLMLPAFETSKS